MTSPESGEQLAPRTFLVSGSLPPAEYAEVLAGLQEHGLTVVELPPGEDAGEGAGPPPAPHTAGLGSVALTARAETDQPPVGLTLQDLYTAVSWPSREEGRVVKTWQALHAAVQAIREAKRDIHDKGRPWPYEIQRLRLLAGLDLTVLPDVAGDPEGREAIDLWSLYRTLRVLLPAYYQKPSPLPGLGKSRFNTLARLVNEQLQPDELVPLAEPTESLPPLSSRELQAESSFVQRVRRGPEIELVTSRDMLRAFGLSIGLSAGNMTYLRRLFASLTALSLGQPPVKLTNAPHWLNDEVCYLGRVTTGELWGIRLEHFVELVCRLEESAELRKQVPGYGVQARQLAPRYLDEVAPPRPAASP